MQKTLSDIPFFFIIGRPRSGTYLLRSLFDAHPNVIIPTECPMIVNLYPKYGKVKNWNKKLLNAFAEDVFLHKDFQKWKIDRQRVRQKILSLEGEVSFQTLIKAVYSEYQSVFPKDEILLFGDKNPVYSTNTEKVMKAFPEARYIHLTRDYRDNLASIQKVDFEAPYPPLIAYRWRFSAKKIHRLKKQYPRHFYSLRYEDLVSAPEKNMQQLCDFLGIPYKASV
ncbi:MAG: sulfotransferase, partial [Bacteroidales bacterium]|nr:sulfotransferase [Bacteroidales bacterium]